MKKLGYRLSGERDGEQWKGNCHRLDMERVYENMEMCIIEE